MDVRFTQRVAKRLRTWDLRQLQNFKEIPEMLGFDSKHPAGHPKVQFLRILVNHCKKSAVKHSIEKPIMLNFVNFSTTFYLRLWILEGIQSFP